MGNRKYPYTQNNCLGRGGSGEVYRVSPDSVDKIIEICRFHKSDENFSLSSIRDIDVRNCHGNRYMIGEKFVSLRKHELDKLRYAERERSMLEKVAKVDNVAKFIGTKFIDWSGMFCYVIKMSYASGDELNSLMYDDKIDLKQASYAIHETAKILLDLKKKHIIHRDVKPKNIIHDAERNKTTLIDFGLAMFEGEIRGIAGNFLFMSPEQHWGEALTTSSDVYNLGVTALVIYSGGSVKRVTSEFGMYPESQNEERKRRYFEAFRRRSIIPDNLVKAIEMTLEKNPSERNIEPLIEESLRFSQS